MTYSTKIDTDWTFSFEPSTGTAHATQFALLVTSTLTFLDLTQFEFGYVKNGNLLSFTRKMPNPSIIRTVPNGVTELFVRVISSSGKISTLRQPVTVSASTLTTSDVDTLLTTQVFDSAGSGFATMQLINDIGASDMAAVTTHLLSALETELNFLDPIVFDYTTQLLSFVGSNIKATATGDHIKRAMAVFDKCVNSENADVARAKKISNS
jgi:hypothetical protein